MARQKARKKKYRRVNYFRFRGEEIAGLKQRPNGRFYAAEDPNKMFGADPAEAVYRFRQW